MTRLENINQDYKYQYKIKVTMYTLWMVLAISKVNEPVILELEIM